MDTAALQTSSQKEKEYIRVAPCLYRNTKTQRYYAVKKVHGKHREHSLGTADRQIAERRLKEWVENFGKVDAEVEKTTLNKLVEKFVESGRGQAKNTQVTTNAIIKSFKKWMGRQYYDEVRRIRPSQLDEWLASEEPRLRNTTYNRYAGFLKQLFELATKDRIIPESPAKALRTPWKKPQEGCEKFSKAILVTQSPDVDRVPSHQNNQLFLPADGAENRFKILNRTTVDAEHGLLGCGAHVAPDRRPKIDHPDRFADGSVAFLRCFGCQPTGGKLLCRLGSFRSLGCGSLREQIG